jgi:hypothetical protein
VNTLAPAPAKQPTPPPKPTEKAAPAKAPEPIKPPEVPELAPNTIIKPPEVIPSSLAPKEKVTPKQPEVNLSLADAAKAISVPESSKPTDATPETQPPAGPPSEGDELKFTSPGEATETVTEDTIVIDSDGNFKIVGGS